MKLGNYEVRFQHDVEGGKTNCTVLQPCKNGLEVVSIGASTVSVDDHYNRKLGRKLTLKRALQSSDLTKEERTSIWKDYLN